MSSKKVIRIDKEFGEFMEFLRDDYNKQLPSFMRKRRVVSDTILTKEIKKLAEKEYFRQKKNDKKRIIFEGFKTKI